jgi:hypothetical protein
LAPRVGIEAVVKAVLLQFVQKIAAAAEIQQNALAVPD